MIYQLSSTVVPKKEQISDPRVEIISTTDKSVSQTMKSAVEKMNTDINKLCSTPYAKNARSVNMQPAWSIAEDFENGACKDFMDAYKNYERVRNLAIAKPGKETSEKYYKALDELIDKFHWAIDGYANAKAQVWLSGVDYFLEAANETGTAMMVAGAVTMITPAAMLSPELLLAGVLDKYLAKMSMRLAERYAAGVLEREAARTLMKEEMKNIMFTFSNYFLTIDITGELGKKITKDRYLEPLAANQAIDMSSFAKMLLDPKKENEKNDLYEKLKQLGAIPKVTIGLFEDNLRTMANPSQNIDTIEYLKSIQQQIAMIVFINANPMYKGMKNMLFKPGIPGAFRN